MSTSLATGTDETANYNRLENVMNDAYTDRLNELVSAALEAGTITLEQAIHWVNRLQVKRHVDA